MTGKTLYPYSNSNSFVSNDAAFTTLETHTSFSTKHMYLTCVHMWAIFTFLSRPDWVVVASLDRYTIRAELSAAWLDTIVYNFTGRRTRQLKLKCLLHTTGIRIPRKAARQSNQAFVWVSRCSNIKPLRAGTVPSWTRFSVCIHLRV